MSGTWKTGMVKLTDLGRACTGDCARCLSTETFKQSMIQIIGGVAFGRISIPEAGTQVVQHMHAYEHATMVTRGRVRLWHGATIQGEFGATEIVAVPAGVLHRFEALEDGAEICCIHAAPAIEGDAWMKERTGADDGKDVMF